jgi:hypothetical protein
MYQHFHKTVIQFSFHAIWYLLLRNSVRLTVPLMFQQEIATVVDSVTESRA